MLSPVAVAITLYRCANLVPETGASHRLRELAMRARYLRADEIRDEVLASAARRHFYTADERAAFELAAEELTR